MPKLTREEIEKLKADKELVKKSKKIIRKC